MLVLVRGSVNIHKIIWLSANIKNVEMKKHTQNTNIHPDTQSLLGGIVCECHSSQSGHKARTVPRPVLLVQQLEEL